MTGTPLGAGVLALDGRFDYYRSRDPSAPDPMRLSSRFNDALCYAAELHRTQVRKGTGVPYLSHLLGVASIALDHGAGEDEAIAVRLVDRRLEKTDGA